MKKIITVITALMLAGCGGAKKAEGQPASSGKPEKAAETAGVTETAAPEQVQADLLQPEVLEFGGGFSSPDHKYIHYGGLIRNPNETVVMKYVKYTVILTDEAGKTVGVDDGVTGTVRPGETYAVEGLINCEGSSPANIQMKTVCSDNDFVQAAKGISSNDLYFRDLSVFERSGYSVVGTLLNNSDLYTDSVRIVAFLRNQGKIVSSEVTFINEIYPGENVFQLDIYGSGLAFDTVELYANDWGVYDRKKIDSWTPETDPVNENVISYSNAAAEPAPAAETSSQSSEDFKKKLDDLEAFLDSYVEFMKNYDSSDTSAMFTYLGMLSKYAEAMKALDEIDESALTPEEEAYYTQVMLRISQKLLEASD